MTINPLEPSNLATLRNLILNEVRLTPADRQLIIAAVDLLRLPPAASNVRPTQPLQARVVLPEQSVERFIAERLRLVPAPEMGGGGVGPLTPESNPQPKPTPDGSTPLDGDASPLPGPYINKDVLLVLLSYLNQLLTTSTVTPFLAPNDPNYPASKEKAAPPESRVIPFPRGQAPAIPIAKQEPTDLRASKPYTSVSLTDSNGLLAQLTSQAQRAAMQLARPPSQSNANTMQGRASASTIPTPTPQTPPPKATVNSDEWIFRLMGIQAAARGLAASQAEKSGTASSAQMAVAMGRLYTQFAKLQHLAQAHVGAQSETGRLIEQHVFTMAKSRLQAYLEHMANVFQNAEAHHSLHLVNILQRAQQEEGWLNTLIEFLETRSEIAKNQNPSKMIPETDLQNKQTTLSTEKSALPVAKDKASINPLREAQSLSSKEAASLVTGQRPEQGQTVMQVFQPRSTAELLGMVQAHLAKNPLAPAHVLIPYPMTIKMEDGVRDVKGAAETQNDPKRGRGKSKRFAEANSQIMCLVPAGPVIVGDSFKEGREEERPCYTEQLQAFLLAATPVTNAQFAAWLNEQLDKKLIHMPRSGYIFDLEGRLLAHTFEAMPMSQIELVVEQGDLQFRAQQYRENHPVVHVSWWGAKAFCNSNSLVLPSEAQWERGGGMLPTAYGQPIKKQRYGCSVDELTNAWANFLPSTQGKTPKENRTSPVGFFDGERVLTVTGKRVETMRAASPWGCFDMSGNVREWIDEDYDDTGHFQLTKGGSYADRTFDLRVAAHLPLLAESTDPYTGFRTAFLLPELNLV